MLKGTVFFLLALMCAASASVLSEAAARLTARKWGLMPTNSTLGALDLHYSLLFWNDSGVWDPVKRKVRWVGGPGTCCANPADYKMINYDEATNVWSVSATPFSGGGHAYDGNAFSPSLGLHYFGLFGSSVVNTWNDTTWGALPAAPFGATTPSVTWFPDINNGQGGLVYHGDGGNLAWYNGSSWHRLTSLGLSSYNSFSEYNPVYKGVWLGGTGSTSNWFLDTNLATRQLANAPFALANGSTIETCDPVSGNFLVYNRDTDVWWELDMVTNTWSEVTDMTPKFALSSAFHAPIPEYGVVLVFNHASSAKYCYLYKHSDFVGVEEKSVQVAMTGLTVSPNPARSTVRIAVEGGASEVRVYDCTGKQVARMAPGVAAVWNTAGLPAGIYLVRARAGTRSMQRTVTVLR